MHGHGSGRARVALAPHDTQLKSLWIYFFRRHAWAAGHRLAIAAHSGRRAGRGNFFRDGPGDYADSLQRAPARRIESRVAAGAISRSAALRSLDLEFRHAAGAVGQ